MAFLNIKFLSVALYQILSILLSPLIDLYLLFRKFKGKEDPIRFKERLGFASKIRPEGKLIWVHCASVGESNSIWPLINKILEINPKINILFTSGTITSAVEIAKKLQPNVIHQFIPVDKFFAARRFIQHWKPSFSIFVESEIWPNLIWETKKSDCNLALINGRISEKSYQRWLFLSKIGFNIFQNFSICFAGSKKDFNHFKNLGLKETYFFGNLKSVCSEPKIDLNRLLELKEMVGSRKIWLAASTHSGEEEIIIKIHQKLKESYPDLLTIIAPRHLNRMKKILSIIPGELKFSLRSQNQKINPDTDIYLADTMGELSLFYNVAKIALIGGSMIKDIGGHNPFEAIKSECIPLSGPYVTNFKEIYEDLSDNNSCIIVRDCNELLVSLTKLIEDKKFYYSILENGSKSLENADEILKNIMNKLKNLITN